MHKKIIALTIVVAGVLLMATPAKAFYLELPNILKFWQGSAKAQEAAPAEVLAPIPTTEPVTTAPAPAPAPTIEPAPVASPVPETNTAPAPAPSTEPQPQPQPAPMPTTDMQPASTCRVNGVDMPGSCDQYNNQLNNNQPMQGGGESGDKNQQMQQQNQERQLKDMRRGIKDVQRNLKEFDRMLASQEKRGMVVPQEIKDERQKAKEMLDAANSATTPEEIGDMSDLWDVVNRLEDFRRESVENFQRLDGMKRGMKGMEQGLKQFEKQVANLAKKKIVVPVEITDNLSKLRTMMNAVKTAKTWEEAEAAGIEEMQDLMQTIDEGRQQLEMLARWPQTLKQINNELKNLDRQLKRDKTIVDRLIKKEIDLTANYEGFAGAIAKLKAVRDDATAKIAAGDSEGAFDAIENDFFSQMEDVWQFDKVIQTMNNLGQFKSDFKKRTAQADLMIKKLVRAKKDVSEAKELLAELKVKGNEILEMLKVKDVDEEAVMGALSELEDLGQGFQDVMSELMGESDIMPWEQGPQQFKQVQMPASVSRNLPQKMVETKQAVQQPKNEMVGESNPSPAP